MNPEKWDALVTDQTMPRMDGVGVLTAARGIRADLPVVVMTGHSEKLSEDDDGGVGADAVVLKPFKRNQLAEILDRLLRVRSH